jgi:hypothetical protein
VPSSHYKIKVFLNDKNFLNLELNLSHVMSEIEQNNSISPFLPCPTTCHLLIQYFSQLSHFCKTWMSRRNIQMLLLLLRDKASCYWNMTSWIFLLTKQAHSDIVYDILNWAVFFLVLFIFLFTFFIHCRTLLCLSLNLRANE